MTGKPYESFISDALAYIGETTANVTCPCCGNQSWVYGKADNGLPRVTLMECTKADYTVQIPALPLTCDKCGFIRMHDVAMIKTKLDERNGQS